MNVLITGITGSGGSYLAEHILQHCPGVQVHGIARWHSTSSHRNLQNIRSKVTVHECDLNDLSSVLSTLTRVKPDAIFHLASHANVRASFDTPHAVMNNNINGTLNLFEGLRLSGLKTKVQLCSTSEVYGVVRETPIDEDAPLRPASPYAISKAAQDMLGDVYYRAYGMPIVRTRMFTYLNPRRADLFATSFALQVARIEAGLQHELTHGNLESVRTFVDVRDAMAAYWAALEKGRPGEVYNIGGQTTLTVGEFLQILKEQASCRIPSRVDQALIRPVDVTLQIPDVRKFEAETGWKPKHSFEESVAFLLKECRAWVTQA